jgi:Tol biopolymer transport system component
VYAPGGDGKGYLLSLRGTTLVAQEFNPGTLELSGEVRAVADPVGKMGPLGEMNVAVSPTGVLVYSALTRTSQFVWLDRAGKQLGTVGEPGQYGTFRLSPDGRRVAMARTQAGAADLWLLEVERPVATRFTSNGIVNNWPVWSPDGATIAFRSTRNLFRKAASGAGTEQPITQSPNTQFATDWSRDGRWILYHELAPGTGRDLWVLPVTPDGKVAPEGAPKPYLKTAFEEVLGRFSPDAPPHWVAYESNETGRSEVYIQAFPEPHGKFPISTTGGQYPQWGPGGRELFYVSPDNKVMVVSLKLGADSVEPSAPRELFSLPAIESGICAYEAAPDGQRFLVRATVGQAGQPLTLIVNWPALLKKPAGVP